MLPTRSSTLCSTSSKAGTTKAGSTGRTSGTVLREPNSQTGPNSTSGRTWTHRRCGRSRSASGRCADPLPCTDTKENTMPKTLTAEALAERLNAFEQQIDAYIAKNPTNRSDGNLTTEINLEREAIVEAL